MKIALLVSGNLGLLMLQKLQREREVACVFTDRNSTAIISYCATHKVPLFTGNPRVKDFKYFIGPFQVDVLLSVNYLFIIPKALIDFPKRYAINIHGSLLPKYRGRTPHVWAIINGETKTGITAHLIDEDCDTGAILEQIEIPITRTDTGNKVLEKYAINYPILIERVLKGIEENTLRPIIQNNAVATYFGKRTAEDGKIDWNWPKEQIYNWVRAQAKPYPGAFTFLNSGKLIIHHLDITNTVLDYSMDNGTIISSENDKLLVKTKDGIVLLSEIENVNKVEIKSGLILN